MFPILLGLLAGIGLPVQTSANTRLGRRLGTPWSASLVSFLVSLAFLLALLAVTGQLASPLTALRGQPLWLFTGGICGVIFLTGNIMLFPRLGRIQTVILPVTGQILMGILIDHFGWLRAEQSRLSLTRLLGAILVVAGVIMVSTARAGGEHKAKDKEKASYSLGLMLWRVFGVCAGMLSAVQTAANGALSRTIASPLWASVISFVVGCILLLILNLVLRLKPRQGKDSDAGNRPWWMWIGGFLGAAYILANIHLSAIVCTGMTVIVLLTGSTAGGVLIDQLGLFGSPKKPVTLQKAAGLLLMLLGVGCIRLL